MNGKRQDFRNNVQEYKRNIILNAAKDIFYEKGYQNTTVDEIAAEMSMSKAVVYWNFNSKIDLLEEIVDRGTGNIAKCVDYIDESRCPSENLAEFCFHHASVVLADQRSFAIFYFERRNFSDNLKEITRDRHKVLVDALVEVLEAGADAGVFQQMDCELVALEILSMISMAFDWSWHRQDGRYSCEYLSRHLAQQALRLAGYDGPFPLAESTLKIEGSADQLSW